MVKSNVKPMPKARRRVEVDRELLRRFLDLVERSRETDRKLAETLAWIDRYRERLRESYR